MPGLHHAWGLAPYDELHALQERLVALRAEGRVPNLLLTGEHPAVITLGRKSPRSTASSGPASSGPASSSPAGSIPVISVERGGEATYHGPGQLVAYPIVHLTEAHRDLHAFQRDLEEVGIRVLAEFGLVGERVAAYTGVWCRGRKVQSLGIAVRRWVTWHGLALNVNNDLAPFRAFNPCGLDGSVMTSMAELLGRSLPMDEVTAALVRHAGNLLPGGPFLPGELPA